MKKILGIAFVMMALGCGGGSKPDSATPANPPPADPNAGQTAPAPTGDQAAPATPAPAPAN